jgi:hypothetical protein
LKIFPRLFATCACVLTLTSCATTINLSATTAPAATTTTTIPTPEGDMAGLLSQMSDALVGLGQAIVDGDKPTSSAKRSQVDAIWVVLEPKIRESGLDLVEDVQRIVNLVHTATDRKRPADADKASRFLALIMESVDTITG